MYKEFKTCASFSKKKKPKTNGRPFYIIIPKIFSSALVMIMSNRNFARKICIKLKKKTFFTLSRPLEGRTLKLIAKLFKKIRSELTTLRYRTLWSAFEISLVFVLGAFIFPTASTSLSISKFCFLGEMFLFFFLHVDRPSAMVGFINFFHRELKLKIVIL